MYPTVLLLLYCLLVALGSVAGGRLPSMIQLTHVRMQVTMSLVSGLMLGVALLHLLPHSLEYTPSIVLATGCMLVGLLVMFFLLRIFHIHYHEDLLDGTGDGGHDHADGHGHDHDHRHNHGRRSQRLGWTGLFIGLAVHSLLDGVALAASVVAEGGHSSSEWTLLGFGTFLAVVLHKPLDALSITALMGAEGWSLRSQSVVNFSFALACPLGALAFWVGISQFVDNHNLAVGCALAFSAGFFLCIALSDLLPEVAFHSHDRVMLSVALLLGVLIAVGVEWLHSGAHEVHAPTGNSHSHSHEP